MFQVFENDRPAEYPFNRDPGWHVSKFETFGEAQSYVFEWVGIYWDRRVGLELNEKYFYSGGEDFVVIKEVL